MNDAKHKEPTMSKVDDAYDSLARLIWARDYMRKALLEAKQVFASTNGPKWDAALALTDELHCEVDDDQRLQDVIDAMEELTEELETDLMGAERATELADGNCVSG